jgi:hypothetical protein
MLPEQQAPRRLPIVLIGWAKTMSESQLSDEELKRVRELLSQNGASGAQLEVVDHLPGTCTWIGSVGRFTLRLFKKTGLAWTLLLLSVELNDAYQFYWPKLVSAYNTVSEDAHKVESYPDDHELRKHSKQYIAFGDAFNPSQLTFRLDPIKPITVVDTTALRIQFLSLKRRACCLPQSSYPT